MNSQGCIHRATGETAVKPKFSDTLTLFQPGGQILPTISAVAPKFPHGYVPASVKKNRSKQPPRSLYSSGPSITDYPETCRKSLETAEVVSELCMY